MWRGWVGECLGWDLVASSQFGLSELWMNRTCEHEICSEVTKWAVEKFWASSKSSGSRVRCTHPSQRTAKSGAPAVLGVFARSKAGPPAHFHTFPAFSCILQSESRCTIRLSCGDFLTSSEKSSFVKNSIVGSPK